MPKYKIKVSVELVECDEAENHEVNKNNDGSFSMVISEQDAISIDMCERSVLQTAATAISRDNMINQYFTTSRCLDALARGNSVKCSTIHSNGSSNFSRNNRSAAVVPSDRFV